MPAFSKKQAIMSNEKSARKLMHVMRQAIRWGDMDVLGHVNNTVYFRYMESGRICFLEEAAGEFTMQGEGPVIVTAYCTFIKQLKYPGEIEIRTWWMRTARPTSCTRKAAARSYGSIFRKRNRYRCPRNSGHHYPRLEIHCYFEIMNRPVTSCRAFLV
jgi:hypothetical protein